jgi:hypothetical protein
MPPILCSATHGGDRHAQQLEMKAPMPWLMLKPSHSRHDAGVASSRNASDTLAAVFHR